MHRVSVLVAERGSDWLAWARVLRARATSTIVLAQPAAEDDAAFARRVSDRINRLAHEGAAVEQAAFIGGDRSDADAKAQRSAIVRRLASLLTGRGRSTKLYLDGATRAGAGSQRLMRALAWAIADWAKGSGLRVLLGGIRSDAIAPRPEPALLPPL